MNKWRTVQQQLWRRPFTVRQHGKSQTCPGCEGSQTLNMNHLNTSIHPCLLSFHCFFKPSEVLMSYDWRRCERLPIHERRNASFPVPIPVPPVCQCALWIAASASLCECECECEWGLWGTEALMKMQPSTFIMQTSIDMGDACNVEGKCTTVVLQHQHRDVTFHHLSSVWNSALVSWEKPFSTMLCQRVWCSSCWLLTAAQML